MDNSIPQGATLLLSFIAGFEAPRGYDTVYGNKMAKMPKPLTSMTLDEVIQQGPWRTKALGSSACGRYQFMAATLQDLRKEMVLMGRDLFTPDLQDRLGLHLLKRRGYDKFMAGKMTMTAFGLGIAQEWASFPVLTACQGAHRPVGRGQSYYAGDGLNRALVAPDAVEHALTLAYATNSVSAALGAPPKPAPVPAQPEPAPAAPAPAQAVPEAASTPPEAPKATGFFPWIVANLRKNLPPKKEG